MKGDKLLLDNGKEYIVTDEIEYEGKTYLYMMEDNENESNNMVSYVKTKFFRFLLLQTLTSIHITKNSFCFVPIQNFTEDWMDVKLYTRYGLTQEEIDFIESMIKPM